MAVNPRPEAPSATLLIGIHREELAFGEAVARGLDRRRIGVLAIPEGLSGRRPRPDQRFRYDTLHRALYLQLLPLLSDSTRLLIDLHTGQDQRGLCADLICAESTHLADRLRHLPRWQALGGSAAVRILQLGPDQTPASAGEAALPGAARVGETAVPPEIRRNPRFLYVGVEVFLPEPDAATPAQQAFARELVTALAETLSE